MARLPNRDRPLPCVDGGYSHNWGGGSQNESYWYNWGDGCYRNSKGEMVSYWEVHNNYIVPNGETIYANDLWDFEAIARVNKNRNGYQLLSSITSIFCRQNTSKDLSQGIPIPFLSPLFLSASVFSFVFNGSGLQELIDLIKNSEETIHLQEEIPDLSGSGSGCGFYAICFDDTPIKVFDKTIYISAYVNWAEGQGYINKYNSTYNWNSKFHNGYYYTSMDFNNDPTKIKTLHFEIREDGQYLNDNLYIFWNYIFNRSKNDN
jgi:hypothetical protein